MQHLLTRFVRPFIAGAALVALWGPAVAQDTAPATVPAKAAADSIDPTPYLGVDWYGVYMQGKKVGYAKMSIEKTDHEGTPAVLSRTYAFFKVMAAGNQLEMKITEQGVFRLAAPQILLAASSVQEQAGQKVETHAKRDGEELVVTRIMGGEEMPAQRLPAPKERLRDKLSGERLVVGKPEVGTKLSYPAFSLDKLEEQTDSLEILKVESGFSNGVETTVYHIQMTDGRTGDRASGKVSDAGKLLEVDVAGGFVTLRLEPEKLAKNIEYSGDLFLGGLAKPDKPIGDPRTVTMLKVRLSGVQDLEVASNGRQNVAKEADGSLVLTMRRHPATGTLDEATTDDIADALKPDKANPSDHPEIIALAKKATESATTLREKMEKLVAFVDVYVRDEMSLTAITALDVLRSKKGDCTEHTALFVSMARAVGLPARPVSGLMYAGDKMGAFGGHAWAEVALDGRWVAVDPTWNQIAVDATHIRLGVESQSETMLKLYGKAKFGVLEIQRGK
jgi:hypothetical protein